MGSNVVMYGSAIIAVLIVIYMLIKKMDIKITLFLMGIILILVATAMGNDIAVKGFESTGSIWLDPLQVIVTQFKQTFAAAGFIILLLGGYTAYMSSIRSERSDGQRFNEANFQDKVALYSGADRIFVRKFIVSRYSECV